MDAPRELAIASAVRRELESGAVDRSLLCRLYGAYASVPDLEAFVDAALRMFPRLCCGLASAVLRHRLGHGAVIRGAFAGEAHTVLLLDHDTIVDVTADQYGGPAVYLGPVRPPWSIGPTSTGPLGGGHPRRRPFASENG